MAREILLVDIDAQTEELAKQEAAVASELARVNTELDKHTCKAGMEDYAIAVASGILSGAIDAIVVGEAALFDFGSDTATSQAANLVRNTAQTNRSVSLHELAAKSDFNGLLQKAYDYVRNNKEINNAINDSTTKYLKDLSKQASPAGIVASILTQLLRTTSYAVDPKQASPQPPQELIENIQQLLVPIVVVGLVNWLNTVSKKATSASGKKDKDDSQIPEAIQRLVVLMSTFGVFDDIKKEADRWLKQQAKNTLNGKRSMKVGYDASNTLFSLLESVAKEPLLSDSGLAKHLSLNPLQASPTQPYAPGKALAKQTIPVLINEAFVRTAYFFYHLALAHAEDPTHESLNWGDIVPFQNRTVERMMTVASMTLAMVDTADAASRASVESAGNWVLYSQRFIARYNYVAAGRAALAVVREFSEEAKEAQLAHERRLLVEAKAALTIERLEAYKAALQNQIDEFIAEDLVAFYEGLSMMDQGLAEGNSDLVIAGNVVIQRVLGREPQFTTQEEFDELMESDDDFVF